jgi:arginyl-tRNA synthetase
VFSGRTGNKVAVDTIPDVIRKQLLSALQNAGVAEEYQAFPVQVVATADKRHGDYQSNVAMVLGKQLKQNPRTLAATLAEHFPNENVVSKPEVAGPGFLNFRLTPFFVQKRLLAQVSDPRLGVPKVEKPLKIIVEFSSPNIAKPMHVGHIRSTILGDALARIARFLGHNVVTDNHIGDWGTQFGKVIYGWKQHLNRNQLAADPIGELVRLYRDTDALAKNDESVLSECRAELVKLQAGDPENRSIWQQCVDLSKGEFLKIYERLGVQFDEQLGESFYNSELATTVRELVDAGIAEPSEGATVVWTREYAETPFIIQKSDGGFGYATTDIATVKYRMKRWNPDAVWYVVGHPQQLHFQQLFSVATRMQCRADLQHIAFGSILGEDKKLMRTRTGDSVALSDLLDEAVERALALVRDKDFDEEQRTQIASMVGLGAIKYAELSQYRITDYVFSWSKMLSFHGNTAPYLQYAYVRSRSIFRKLNEPYTVPNEVVLREPIEVDLVKKMLQYGEVVTSVLDGFRPNQLANYLYELAAQFHSFFEVCPVLTAPEELRPTRLLLCDLFGKIINGGLTLLGIETPEKM